MLTQEIKKIHQRSKGPYGAPRIHAELAEQGWHVGRKRVTRLMKAADLRGVSPRKAPRTTQRSPKAQPATDLVQRDFTASRPNDLWVADTPALACGASVTYIATWAGFLYLAVVVDAWAMATQLRTELVLEALHMAIQQRHPQNVIHHSDHGGQYTSLAFGRRCREAGIRPSRARSAIATIMLSARASSLLSNANCWTAPPSTHRPNPVRSFLSSSKAGTIRIVVTLRSTISHPTGTKPCMLVPHDPKSLPVH